MTLRETSLRQRVAHSLASVVNDLTERPPRLFRALFPGALFRLPTDKKIVALTFDDGPVPGATPEVLRILAAEDVKATFFMVGDNVRKYPDLARRVRDEGHSFGSHTFHHIQGLHTSVSAYLSDVVEGNRQIRTAVGETRLFRPPHGLLRPGELRGVRSRGMKVVMFDLVSRDYDPRQTPAEMLRMILRKVRPGSIIVFHDSLRSIAKLRVALPQLLRALRDAGYSFTSLNEV